MRAMGEGEPTLRPRDDDTTKDFLISVHRLQLPLLRIAEAVNVARDEHDFGIRTIKE